VEHPKSRKQAQAMGATHYFTGKPCKHGHVALRKTRGSCVECAKAEWQANAPKRAEYFAAYNKTERKKEAQRAYYEANRDQVIARAMTQPSYLRRKYRNAWKARNVDQVKADTTNRRRRHREATPKWLTRAQKGEMREIYRIAITMTKTTGEQYVVDHIVPLRSDVVCGLHVPWNLRVVTAAENTAKSNKLLQD
jgi:hypothetical protein